MHTQARTDGRAAASVITEVCTGSCLLSCVLSALLAACGGPEAEGEGVEGGRAAPSPAALL